MFNLFQCSGNYSCNSLMDTLIFWSKSHRQIFAELSCRFVSHNRCWWGSLLIQRGAWGYWTVTWWIGCRWHSEVLACGSKLNTAQTHNMQQFDVLYEWQEHCSWDLTAPTGCFRKKVTPENFLEYFHLD